MYYFQLPDGSLVGDYLKSLKPTSDLLCALTVINLNNAFNYLNFILNLSNCSNYQKIKAMINSIKVVNEDMQEIKIEDEDTTEWYAVYVIKNKEITITEKIKTNIRHNLLPNGEALLKQGIIDKNFYIGDYIYDVAFAHTFDTSVQRITSNLHSYIFIQVEKTDVTFFNNVIVPFLKMTEGVIGICGVQIPTKYRKTEIIRQNKREKVKRNKIYVTKPVGITTNELEHSCRMHNSFSSYPDSDTDYKVGDILYYWRLNRKKQPTVFIKVKILKFKDDITCECLTVGKIEEKIVLGVTSLTKTTNAVIDRYK